MKFLNIFKKTNKEILSEPINLGLLNTDIHSHLIPGIDDGSKTMEESIFLLKELSALGYKKVITTPHIMCDYYRNTPEIINEGLEKLRNEIKIAEVNIEIEAAAEYLIDDGFEKLLEQNNLLTFGKKYLLVEMPYLEEPPKLKTILFNLQTEGYKIVLAHPERYNYWHLQPNKYTEMKDRGIYFQLNINSLSGFYGEAVKKMANTLIKNNMIDFLGTDLHNGNYLESLKKATYLTSLEYLLNNNKIINNTL